MNGLDDLRAPGITGKRFVKFSSRGRSISVELKLDFLPGIMAKLHYSPWMRALSGQRISRSQISRRAFASILWFRLTEQFA
jgi:hypothetical protein